MPAQLPPDCPYCEQPAELVSGRRVYPHRRDLYRRWFWLCAPCNAWTDTHENSKRHAPKGRLANKALREARGRAHDAFDPLWKATGVPRPAAYQWLADHLGIPFQQCHIGFFDLEECERVVQIVQRHEPPTHPRGTDAN